MSIAQVSSASPTTERGSKRPSAAPRRARDASASVWARLRACRISCFMLPALRAFLAAFRITCRVLTLLFHCADFFGCAADHLWIAFGWLLGRTKCSVALLLGGCGFVRHGSSPGKPGIQPTANSDRSSCRLGNRPHQQNHRRRCTCQGFRHQHSYLALNRYSGTRNECPRSGNTSGQ